MRRHQINKCLNYDISKYTQKTLYVDSQIMRTCVNLYATYIIKLSIDDTCYILYIQRSTQGNNLLNTLQNYTT